MGTFERIRKISPYALVAFAIIFVGFMVASDADISNLIRQGQDYRTAVIGKINGEKILYKNFQEEVREQIEQQRKQSTTENMDIDESQVRKSLWAEKVEEILLNQEAKKMGIRVTDEEILDVLLDNPPDYLRKPFTDSAGNFQRQAYLEIITNPDVIYKRLPNTVPQEEKRRIVEQFKKDLINIEKYLRKEHMLNSIRTLVAIASSFASPTYAKLKYIKDNSIADVRAIFFDVKDIPDKSVSVTEEEIKQYYEENKQFYPEKPRRKIKYAIFKIVPSQQDTNLVQKSINKFAEELSKLTDISERSKLFEKKFKEYNGEISDFKLAKDLPSQLAAYITTTPIGQVVGPIQTSDGVYFIRLEDIRKGENEVVRASHILIEFGNNKDSALAFAKEILAKAKKGEEFETLARKYSQDKGSAMNGGDLGYFGKGMMVKPFEDACFAAKPGEIIGPIETQFGYHIIKIYDKKSDEYKYSFIKFAPTVSRTTERILARNAKMLKEKVEKGTPFESAAKEFNVVARTTDFFERTRPVLGSNYLTSLAFEAKVGEVLEPFELKNQGIIVAQVVDERKGGFTPLEDLREKIKFTLMKRKKLDLLEKKANEVYNRIKNLGTLQAVQQIDSTMNFHDWHDIRSNGFITGFGQDYAFTEKIFLVPMNSIVPPFRGERGYYIFEVYRRVVPDEVTVKNEWRKSYNNIVSNWRQSAYMLWFNKVKENAEIKDYRYKFYRDF
jgi:peptidyl-prolyl cis-trans isomerase D